MRILRNGLCHSLVLTVLTCSLASSDDLRYGDEDDKSYFTNDFAVLIEGGVDVARDVALEHGYQLKMKIGSLPGYYLLRHEEVPVRSRRETDEHHTYKLARDSRVQWFQQQEAKTRTKRNVFKRSIISSNFNDPLYDQQWYLNSQEGGERKILPDMRIKQLWERGITGKGVVVAIVDDGLEKDHTDLAKNYDPRASWNFKEDRQDPTPPESSYNHNGHGTRCAGEVAMEADNEKCGVGIAFDANIGGIRLIDGHITDAEEGAALSYNLDYIDIYSASWGPTDDGRTTTMPGPIVHKAFERGIKEGRNGKGVLYAWASGNGGKKDNCNCDAYSSSIYTIATASVSESGLKTYYGEKCSSILTTSYSSGTATADHSVVSSDLRDGCTSDHGGTSAAAPMTAGVLALLLQVNPDLTWRDAQHIIVLTSSTEHLQSEPEADWRSNAAGHDFSDYFGFGLLDAEAMASLANPKTWIKSPEKSICTVEAGSGFNSRDLENHQSLEMDIVTDACKGTSDEVNSLEHVILYVSTEYSKRGALNIHLTSPSGTETKLLSRRYRDTSHDAMTDFPLMSVQLWGEDPSHDEGVWRLHIFDSSQDDDNHGSLLNWKLELHGTKEMPNYYK